MNVFDLVATISLDTSGYEKELGGAEDKAKSFGSKLKGGLAAVGKVGGAIIAGSVATATTAIAAGVTAAVGFAKQATTAYADYEQLVGGAELLFGDAYDYIADKSKTAYKDVQMSQNDYLRQVNGFAVGLKTALGGNEQAAAELAAKIVTAEADVVAATGNTQEAVQNAFNGIMKGNYTMLDNLQLGITPTKEGMQEVIDKVNEWNEANGRATAYEIDNLADVQSALVDYIEMQGLAGYAANEAADTISGSGAAAKAAWDDLLVSLAKGEGIAESVRNFASAASSYVKNLIPVFTEALSGVATMIQEIVPVLAAELPNIADTLIPVAIEAGISIVEAIAGAFPKLIPMIINILNKNMSKLITAGMTIIKTLGESIVDSLPMIVDAAIEIVQTLITSISEEGGAGKFIEAAFSIIGSLLTSIGEALPELIPAAVSIIIQIVEGILDNIDLVIDGAIALITGLAEGIVNAIPILIEKAPEIISKLVQAIIQNAPKLFDAASEIINKLAQGIAMLWESVKSWGVDIINKIWEGIKSLWSSIATWGREIIDKVWSGLKGAINDAVQWGKDLIVNFWNGIKSKLSWLWDGVKSVASGIKSFLGFSEPEKGPLSDFHTYAPDMMNLFIKGINDNKRKLTDAVANAFDFENLMTAPDAGYGSVRYPGSARGAVPAMAGAAPEFNGVIDLYIDKYTLVGSTSEEMDRNLGDIQKIKARWGGRK